MGCFKFIDEEQKGVFSVEESSAFMLGAFDILSGNIYNIEKVKRAFKTGKGINYNDSHLLLTEIMVLHPML